VNPSALLLLLVLATLGSPLSGQTSLDYARRARALLGEGVWSRVLEIRNENRRSPYPNIVHALVFELAGILWFYTDTDGTQSFSLHRGRLAEEKADFSPLLRGIDAGFSHWSVLAPATEPAGAGLPLKNGCFIESIVELRARVARGARVGAPRLLSYYAKSSLGQEGHTVLAYDVDRRTEIYDPARPQSKFSFPLTRGRAPLALAQALDRREIVGARYLTLETESGPGLFAAREMPAAERVRS
jgi:hypothetical protein